MESTMWKNLVGDSMETVRKKEKKDARISIEVITRQHVSSILPGDT